MEKILNCENCLTFYFVQWLLSMNSILPGSEGFCWDRMYLLSQQQEKLEISNVPYPHGMYCLWSIHSNVYQQSNVGELSFTHEVQAAVSTMPVVSGSGMGARSSGLSDQCGMENRSNKILLVWKINENTINITILTDITWDTQKKAQGHCE